MTLLVKHNAGTEARDEEDQTILHIATYFINVEVARLIIKYNADIETWDEDERASHDTATYYHSRENVRLSLEHKSDTAARSLDN